MMLILDHEPITVAVGTRDFGPAVIPDGLTTITLRLARKTTATPTFWADGVHVNVDSWCSLDGGATWIQWLGFGAEGGIFVIQPTLEEVAESSVRSVLPAGGGRRLKVQVRVAGGTLVSELTVEVT